VLWIATKHGDEGIGYEANDENDFAKGKPELGLAIPSDSKYVDKAVRYVNDGFGDLVTVLAMCMSYPYSTMMIAMTPPTGTASLH